MVSDRGLQVLRAIVQDYVDTREPVGSKAIVDRHAFGVSAATIRNDMAQLEDEELITAPHTSSGRVPTDKGYRVFVDHLAQVRPLSPAQRAAITEFLADPGDLDALLGRTVRLLSRLTGQVALVQYPSFAQATVTHIEFVPLGGARVVLILVADSGYVSQRVATLGHELTSDEMDAVRMALRRLLTNRSVAAGSAALADVLGQAPTGQRVDSALQLVARVAAEELDEFRQDRLVMAGSASLARRVGDFRGSISPLLEAIEEQVTLLRLMTEMVTDEQGLAASIGRENQAFGLEEASVVTGDYDTTGSRARIGVLGPTRMDYPTNLAAVRAVARYLSRILEEDERAR